MPLSPWTCTNCGHWQRWFATPPSCPVCTDVRNALPDDGWDFRPLDEDAALRRGRQQGMVRTPARRSHHQLDVGRQLQRVTQEDNAGRDQTRYRIGLLGVGVHADHPAPDRRRAVVEQAAEREV